MRNALVVAAGAVILLNACLGREVVGVRPMEERPTCNDVPFICAAHEPVLGLAPLEEDQFGPLFAPDCGFEPSYDLCAELTSSVGMGSCSESSELVLDQDMELRMFDFSCSTLAIRLSPGVHLTISDSQFTAAAIEVSGDVNSSLSIAQSRGNNLRVQLSGHVWLEVTAGSAFEDLAVEIAPSMEGRALLLSDADVVRLRVRGGERTTAHVRRSTIDDSLVQIGELISEEAYFNAGRIQTARSLSAGGGFEEMSLELGVSAFVGSTVVRSTIHTCETVRFSEALVIESRFAPCTDAAEFSGGSVAGSEIAGSVRAQATGFSTSGLVPGPGGSLEFAGVSVFMSAFCDTTQLAAHTSNFQCVSCDPAIESPDLAGTLVVAPECPSLELAAAAAAAP